MKSRTIHLAGGVLASVFLVVLGMAMTERTAALALNRALLAPPAVAATAAPEDPRISAARGVQLARANELDGARRNLQLAVQGNDERVSNQARFNLGNLALREALAMQSDEEKQAGLLALAKQHYREVLLREPQYWAARYNLERALWLAPEAGIAATGDSINTAKELEGSTSRNNTNDGREGAATTMQPDGGGLP
ncbi:MxaK protein [Actimicrobium sp. CCI2.3]|uniref:MxaK protein n=1 Tax=Actimicrobium sp. CCI2.3 TaxID=3048616 RepID=UPI002AB3A269|nr:MxaK protein [Actimicrobium sp. CCI2.3]MDY7575151.1 MxaK protein [Actimicrobium sp. CCI2.3]MEB0023596.1 MxaK protein [Actimicrobium sp. CCI2.3]